jgi:hypothetical protein
LSRGHERLELRLPGGADENTGARSGAMAIGATAAPEIVFMVGTRGGTTQLPYRMALSMNACSSQILS